MVFLALPGGFVARAASCSGVSDCQSQISAAQAAAAAAQAQASAAGTQATTYQQKVNQLNAQVVVLQDQIYANQLQYSQLQSQIAANNASLVQQKATLADAVKQIYLEQAQSPLETLVSSSNLSDFFTKQEYQDKVKTAVQGSMAAVVKLQSTLTNESKQVSGILADLQGQQAQVQASEQQAYELLATAQQSAAAADQQVVAENAQVKQLQSAQAAFARQIGTASSGALGSFQYANWTGNSYCGGGYPSVWCGATQDYLTDSWALYNRECTSYAAWAMTQLGANVPSFHGVGMAYQWPSTAANEGFAVNSNPNGTAVAVVASQSMLSTSSYTNTTGHVMAVDSVYTSGPLVGWIHVSQYNFGSPMGEYSQMDVKIVPGLQFIHFR